MFDLPKIAQDRSNGAFRPAFVKNDVRLEAHGRSNTITIYTNDWCSVYETRLRGKMPFLKLVGRERCYR